MSLILSHGPVKELRLKREDGHHYDLINLKPEDFPIDILASALAQINRFGGESRHPWSVASHSVLVSLLLPERFQYEGLMHDITEGTGLNDMASPVKKLLPDYQKLEAHVRKQLAPVYGLAEVEPAEVKAADRRAFEIEDYYLRGAPCKMSKTEFQIADALLSQEIPWHGSKKMFMNQYRHLMGVRGFN
jgi:hypothetical protein